MKKNSDFRTSVTRQLGIVVNGVQKEVEELNPAKDWHTYFSTQGEVEEQVLGRK